MWDGGPVKELVSGNTGTWQTGTSFTHKHTKWCKQLLFHDKLATELQMFSVWVKSAGTMKHYWALHQAYLNMHMHVGHSLATSSIQLSHSTQWLDVLVFGNYATASQKSIHQEKFIMSQGLSCWHVYWNSKSHIVGFTTWCHQHGGIRLQGME